MSPLVLTLPRFTFVIRLELTLPVCAETTTTPANKKGRARRVASSTPSSKHSSTDPYTPRASDKTRRPTAAPERYHLLTSPDFGDPPAATAAAAA